MDFYVLTISINYTVWPLIFTVDETESFKIKKITYHQLEQHILERPPARSVEEGVEKVQPQYIIGCDVNWYAVIL